MPGPEPADRLLEAEGTSDLPGGLLPESCSSWGVVEAKGCVASEACARRKECDIGGPKLQTYVSILTDSSLPEGIVKHKLVWDTDGVGLSGCSCVGTCIRGAVDHRRGRFSSLWGKKRMGDDAIGRARCPPRRFACRRACSERGFARIKQRHN
ncbi:hypothetical protein DPSP01_001331 [Paraphaeosphaeria sporulosa]|uniref:Uncharacterized protein n=1 Tax=Paraphaeosphaeria sporulosa TaxID=1460663 RepID=A0A177BZW6_9PLEO|nr:uncharacterized protein CC84DRAFT_308055 [Paraphaeosphaeria sporulosa]OAG00531.1 hypothetical protein CC84DRAFT_308055 [Paraphaeosphaeria sporulosa]